MTSWRALLYPSLAYTQADRYTTVPLCTSTILLLASPMLWRAPLFRSLSRSVSADASESPASQGKRGQHHACAVRVVYSTGTALRSKSDGRYFARTRSLYSGPPEKVHVRVLVPSCCRQLLGLAPLDYSCPVISLPSSSDVVCIG